MRRMVQVLSAVLLLVAALLVAQPAEAAVRLALPGLGEGYVREWAPNHSEITACDTVSDTFAIYVEFESYPSYLRKVWDSYGGSCQSYEANATATTRARICSYASPGRYACGAWHVRPSSGWGT